MFVERVQTDVGLSRVCVFVVRLLVSVVLEWSVLGAGVVWIKKTKHITF